MTRISAPASFGKTTLVGDGVQCGTAPPHAFPRTPRHVIWLTLGKSDDDPARCCAYLIAALRTIEPGLAQGLLSALQPPQPSLETVLVPLIIDLAALQAPIVLVLDDYHLVEPSPFTTLWAFFWKTSRPRPTSSLPPGKIRRSPWPVCVRGGK